MLKRIKNRLNKRKAKVFLLFLLCSFLAWSISKFSESYESRASFKLNYQKFPDSLSLNKSDSDFFVAKLRANGFQFLSYSLNQKEIDINLRQVSSKGNTYYLTDNEIKAQMERQLSNTVSLLELEKDTFYIDLYKIIQKEIPIKSNVTIGVAPNHLLVENLKLEPPVVTIKGPSKEVSKINEILTEELILSDLSTSFSKELKLIKPKGATNTILLDAKTQLVGKVVEFSEKEFNVAISAENLPEGYGIKMFPNEVKLICKASVDRLKTMKSSDFGVIVDYNALDKTSSEYLNVRLKHKPKEAYSVQLLTNQVEFVLEKL